MFRVLFDSIHVSCVCVEVSDHGVVILELDSGLNFPASEHLSRLVYTHALQGKTDACIHRAHDLDGSHYRLVFHRFSVSSALSGSRLFSCQLYRLHCCSWTWSTSPAVWSQRNFTGLCRTEGSLDKFFFFLMCRCLRLSFSLPAFSFKGAVDGWPSRFQTHRQRRRSTTTFD